MALPQEVRGSFKALVDSGNIRYAAYPVGAGVAMVSDGAAAAWAWAAYVQIVVAATITDPSWLLGFLLHTGAVETHYGDLALASGADGAEVDLAIVPFQLGLPAATANTTYLAPALPTWLPYAIKIIGAPRLAGRIRKDTAKSAAGGTLKVIVATAVGT